ncbi:MAG: alginate lyase family protein [Mangrovibacterium sp.]|jgi:hypothetical protein
MDLDRRIFLKKLSAGSAGIVFPGTSRAGIFFHSPLYANPKSSNGVVFPFFKYMQSYNFGDYLPKDQGGKFIQMQLIDSESDYVIVEAVRNKLFQKVYGDPIGWGKLEITELEKSVWLNRFYYLPSFARLYYLSGDQSYLEEMMELVRLWIKDNPRTTEHPTSKYNWYDMQVAWRSIHLSWCYYLGEKGLSDDDKSLIIDTLKEHAEILEEGFGRQKLNEFNHQAHGALGMVYLGILFPGLPQAKQLREGGIRILEHHIQYAFYEDGGNVEQMFGYYPFEASIFRDAYLLCRENGFSPPENVQPLLQKMANYLLEVAQPDGTMPPINDSYAMPVNPTLDTIRELVDPKGLGKTNAGSFYFPVTQIGVMRSDASNQNSWYLLANPAKTIGSHAHAGRLGFLTWFGQQPVMIESGCNSYDDPQLVNWYRTSKAHNTVLIDGKADEATSGDKQWAGKRQTDNRITDWIKRTDYRLIRMNSPATDETNNLVNWTRSLALVRNDYLLIYDYFEATEQHDYEILLHLPQVEVEADKKAKTILMKAERPIAFLPANAAAYDRLKVEKGYISELAKDKLAPVVSYHITGKETHSVLMVTPLKHSPSEFSLKQEILADGIGLTVESPSGKKDTILFRKPGAKSFSYQNHQTKEWMAVF